MPRGVSTLTVAPTLVSISARPIGDSAERRPSARFGLGRADQGPDVGLAFAFVEHFGAAAEGEGVGLGGVDLDHDRVVQPLLQALDPRLHVRLVLFGDVILGVLLEVALLARDLDPRRHLLPRRPFELRQLGFQLLDSGRGDRLPA